MNDALQAEEREHFAIKRHVIDINPEAGMAEDLIDEKKIAGPRPEIENMLRPHAVEADVLNPPDVHSQKTLGLNVLRPLRCAWHSIGLLNPFQLCLIDLRHEAAHRKRTDGTANRPSRAHDRRGIREFSYFVRKLHAI